MNFSPFRKIPNKQNVNWTEWAC